MQPSLFKAKSEWCTPTEFPDLSKYDEIAIDLETKDPELTTKGSCSVRGGGDVVGVAVAVTDWCGYYPFGLSFKHLIMWAAFIFPLPITFYP